nr:HupE/UreJ family protein [Novosphingobium sp. 9]
MSRSVTHHWPKLAALLPLFAASPALAHPGHDFGTGALAGFVHPFTGADHLTAMICVGLWSARAYPGKIWALPAAFMSAMAAGFLVGHTGITIPAETIVLLSMPLLALGAILARVSTSSSRLPSPASSRLLTVMPMRPKRTDHTGPSLSRCWQQQRFCMWSVCAPGEGSMLFRGSGRPAPADFR